MIPITWNIYLTYFEGYSIIFYDSHDPNIGSKRTEDFDYIANYIEYIPLEYSEKSIVGKVFQRGTVFENDTLFIMQMNGDIKIFDSTGKLIRTFNRMGRSSQEYSFIKGLHISSKNNIINSTLNTCKEYTPLGEYVRDISPFKESSAQNISNWDFAIFSNKLAFAPDLILNDNNNYSAIITDSLSNILLKVEYPKDERQMLKEQDWSQRATYFSVDFPQII